MQQARSYLICVFALALGACGHRGAPAGSNDAGAAKMQADAAGSTQAAVEPPRAAAPIAEATRPLQVGDLDAYAKGMQKEIALLKAASDKAMKAKAANDQNTELEAMVEATSVEIDKAGAAAAGMDRARYDFIKHAVDKSLSIIDMNNAFAKMGAPADFRGREADPYAGLDVNVAAALKTREAEFAQLRNTDMAILAHLQEL